MNEKKETPKTLILMQGVSGSGKSTLAHTLKQGFWNQNIPVSLLSTDNHFKRKGKYSFDPNLLHEFHRRTEDHAMRIMSQGTTIVIIDNSNCKKEDVRAYWRAAQKFGYTIQVMRVEVSLNELKRRNATRTDKQISWHVISRQLNNMENLIETPFVEQKIVCTAVNFSETARKSLQNWWQGRNTTNFLRRSVRDQIILPHENLTEKFWGHCLLWDRPPVKHLLALDKKNLIGRKVRVQIVGYKKLSQMQVFAVKFLDVISREPQLEPHLCLSTKTKISFYSVSELLKRSKIQPIDNGLIIEGRVGYFEENKDGMSFAPLKFDYS